MATKRLHDAAQKEREANCLKVHCIKEGTLRKGSGRTIQLNREAVHGKRINKTKSRVLLF